MTLARWSVRIAVDDSETAPISRVLHQAVTSEVVRLSVGGPAGDHDDGAPVVTFELEASDARNATLLAQHLLGKVRRAAGLKPKKGRLVWVAPVLATEGSGHRFLEHARELFDSGDAYDLAVVAAQIHLEAQVRALAEEALTRDGSPLALAVRDQRRPWAPHHPSTQPILEALFDIKMANYPLWKEYRTHLARRNDVVHGGQNIDGDSARDSIDLVEDFWLWLNARGQRRVQEDDAPRETTG